MYLAEIEIIQNMSSLDLEVSVESILGKVPLRSSQAVTSDEMPHGVSVQPGELSEAAPGHQDDGVGGGGHQTGAAHVLLETVGDQADDLQLVLVGQTGVVEEHNTAVLQVMLPPLHWEVTKQSTLSTNVNMSGRVEHSHWSRSLEILGSDWLNLTMHYAVVMT